MADSSLGGYCTEPFSVCISVSTTVWLCGYVLLSNVLCTSESHAQLSFVFLIHSMWLVQPVWIYAVSGIRGYIFVSLGTFMLPYSSCILTFDHSHFWKNSHKNTAYCQVIKWYKAMTCYTFRSIATWTSHWSFISWEFVLEFVSCAFVSMCCTCVYVRMWLRACMHMCTHVD